MLEAMRKERLENKRKPQNNACMVHRAEKRVCYFNIGVTTVPPTSPSATLVGCMNSFFNGEWRYAKPDEEIKLRAAEEEARIAENNKARELATAGMAGFAAAAMAALQSQSKEPKSKDMTKQVRVGVLIF